MSKNRKARVVNIVHVCEIYEGGSVLELGYVIPFRENISKAVCDSHV